MADLSDSIETIIDSVVDAVKAEMGGGTLSDVKTVIRGDRARPMPEMPAVWIVPQAAQQRAETYGEETWELPLSIAALVKGADPAEAGKAAQRITSLAQGRTPDGDRHGRRYHDRVDKLRPDGALERDQPEPLLV
jgi:hypothetical protein